jgi:hypothetical protein
MWFESSKTIANRAKGKILLQIKEDKKRETQLINFLHEMRRRTLMDMEEIRALLQEVISAPASEEKENARHALTDLLAVFSRTVDTLDRLITLVTNNMNEKEEDVIRVLGV